MVNGYIPTTQLEWNFPEILIVVIRTHLNNFLVIYDFCKIHIYIFYQHFKYNYLSVDLSDYFLV